MTKLKILALLVGMVLLFTLPATVSAQRLPPHVFVGTAMMDGAMPADGTTVTAWVGGMEAASTTVSGGGYTLIVDQGDQSFSGETITFQIGGNDAMETAMWMQGGGDELNLSASSAMAGEVVTIDLGQMSASGQSGTATLTELGSMTLVELTLSAGASQTELVHIHAGQCGDSLGDVAYTLASFEGGSGASSTRVDVTLAMIQDGNHAINSHDASNPGTYTACGNIPGGAMAPGSTPVAMSPGATGVPGSRGPAGSSGPDGAAGPAGAQGDTGPSGSAGRDGSAGAKGDTGSGGSAGAKGAAGPAGSSGGTGPAGAAGAAGAEGDDGSNALGIVALILAIIAIVGAGGAFMLGRRS